MRRGAETVVFEQPPTAAELEEASGRGVLLSELIAGVRDVYSPDVFDDVVNLLGCLRHALGAEQWEYAGVPLWDTVVCDFHWRYLDPVFRHVDAAEQLLDTLRARSQPARRPWQIAFVGAGSAFARVLTKVAHSQGLSVAGDHDRRDVPRAALRACAVPYLAHLRDCLRTVGVRARPLGTRRPVVLLNHAWRNFEVVEPALRELQHRLSSDDVVVVQTSPDGQHEIEQAGFACRPYDHYVSPIGGLRALIGAAPVIRFLTSGRWKARASAEHVTWRGTPIAALAEHEISVGLARLIGNMMRELACARTVLVRERPAVVVTTEDRSTSTRAMAFSARA